MFAALALIPANAQSQPSPQCFARTYTAQHLAKHPQQTVTSVTLSLYTGRNAPQLEFWIWVTKRGDTRRLYTGGLCHPSNERGKPLLSCTVDCDGGGIGIETRKQDGSILVHLATPLGYGHLFLSSSCGDDVDPTEFTLTPGIDDKSFRLDPTSYSVCRGLEAQLPAGDDQ